MQCLVAVAPVLAVHHSCLSSQHLDDVDLLPSLCPLFEHQNTDSVTIAFRCSACKLDKYCRCCCAFQLSIMLECHWCAAAWQSGRLLLMPISDAELPPGHPMATVGPAMLLPLHSRPAGLGCRCRWACGGVGAVATAPPACASPPQGAHPLSVCQARSPTPAGPVRCAPATSSCPCDQSLLLRVAAGCVEVCTRLSAMLWPRPAAAAQVQEHY